MMLVWQEGNGGRFSSCTPRSGADADKYYRGVKIDDGRTTNSESSPSLSFIYFISISSLCGSSFPVYQRTHPQACRLMVRKL